VKRSNSTNPCASAREAVRANVVPIRVFCRVTLFLLNLSHPILMFARVKTNDLRHAWPRLPSQFQRLIAAQQ
jgi:hypothetical protein